MMMMKTFIELHHKFTLGMITSSLLGLLLIIPASDNNNIYASSVLVPRSIVLASQADSRMISDVGCQTGGGSEQSSSSSACSVVSGDWNSKSYLCDNNFEVTSTALMSATDGVLTKPSPEAHDNIPAFAKNCEGTIHVLEHPPWILFYSISTECKCPKGTLPECSGAKKISEKACNVATYNFCGITSKNNPSTPCIVKQS